MRFGTRFSTLLLVALFGCGRTLLDGAELDESAGASGSGGTNGGSASAGVSGSAFGGSPQGGSPATGGISSGGGGTSAGKGGSSTGKGGSSTGGASCDADGDGIQSVECGGLDCDDEDERIPDDNDTNARRGGGFHAAVIAEHRGPSDVAIDVNGEAHVAYAADGVVHHLVKKDEQTWHTDFTLTGEYDYTSSIRLALDSQGQATLLVGGPGAPLMLAEQREDDWFVSELADDGVPVSLVIEPFNDTMYLAYLVSDGAGHTELRYTDTYNDLGEERVYAGVRAASLAIEAGYAPRIAFVRDRENDVLVGYRNAFNSWRFEPVGISPSPDLELGPSALAIDRNGVAELAVSVDGVLTLATRMGDWQVELVPALPDVSTPFIRFGPGHTLHLLAQHPGQVVTYREFSDGTWTDEEQIPSYGFLRGFAVDRGRALHVTLEAGVGLGREYVAYTTNRTMDTDGIDRNCDGVDGVDLDGDGQASVATGGLDCDDRNPDIYFGASDDRGDGVDSDCNHRGACPKGLPGQGLIDMEGNGGTICIDRNQTTNREYDIFLSSKAPLPPGPPGGPYYCSWNASADPAPEGTVFRTGPPCPTFDPENDPDRPVVCIDWCDAWSYCRWAGKRLCTGPYELPQDSEWQQACVAFDGLSRPNGGWEWQDICRFAMSNRDACFAYGDPMQATCFRNMGFSRDEAAGDLGFRCCADPG